jgi:hypothetical protein
VYTADELSKMQHHEEIELSPWGCQAPKGQTGPGILLCN